MTDNIKSAFDETLTDRIIGSVPDMPDHIFSKNFERSMDMLIKHGEAKPIKRKISMRRIAAIITAAILAAAAAAFSSGALKDLFGKFFMEKHPTHTSLHSTDTETSPKSIEKVCLPDVPFGMKLISSGPFMENEPMHYTTYGGGDKLLSIVQYTKNGFSSNVDTEGNKLEYISLNGCKGLFIDTGRNYIITVDNGEYIFQLCGTLTKDEIIKAAASLCK